MQGVSETKTAPEYALKRLAAIDSRLSMIWVDGIMQYWAITEKWLPSDPRWEGIKKGEVPPDKCYDIKAGLPKNCSPYEVEGYIASRFERVTDPAKQAQEAVDSVAQANAKAQAAIKEAFVDEQGEKGLRTTKHDLEVEAGLATANAQIIVPANIGKGKRK